MPSLHYIQVCAQDSEGLAWPRAFARRGCRAARGASPRAPGALGSVARRASEAERIALLCAWALSCRPASRRAARGPQATRWRWRASGECSARVAA